MTRQLNRRDFLKMMAGASGGALLASCAPKVVKETVVVEKPVEKVVKETVVVEKVVEKPVEKVVKETVVVEKSVEKVITATPSPRTVMRFQTWTDPGLANMQQLMGAFSAEHPGLEVEIEPPAPGALNQMVPLYAAGTAPDIVDMFGDLFTKYAQRGVLMDLQPLIDGDLTSEQIADWHQGQYEMFQFDGKRFGLGKHCGTMAWVVNKEIWERFGADEPSSDWDWETCLENCLKITTHDSDGVLETAGISAYLDNWMWSALYVPFVQTWGGEIIDTDLKTSLVHEPEALAALQFIQDLRWEYEVIPKPDDWTRMLTIGAGLLATGKVGMHSEGPWGIKTVLQTCDFPLDFIENPLGPTGKRSTFFSSDCYTVTEGTKAPEACWELMKFLCVDDRWQKMGIEKAFFMPTKQSLLDSWTSAIRGQYPRVENADLEAYTRALDYARKEVRYCDQQTALDLTFPVIDEVYLLNKRSATEAFAELSPKITAALKEICG